MSFGRRKRSCSIDDYPYLLRWPVTGVFIVNETLNETRRNTQKLFSHHEETVLQSCSTSNRRRFVPRRRRAGPEELEQYKYASTGTRPTHDANAAFGTSVLCTLSGVHSALSAQ